MTLTRSKLATGLCALWALSSPTQAQVFTDEALFLAATGPLAGESFECFETGDVSAADPLVTPAFSLSIAPVLASTVAPMNIQTSPNPNGPHATDGSHFVQCGATPSSNGQFDLTIQFAAPVESFGLTVTDFGEYSHLTGTLTATILGTPYTIASNPPLQPDGSERFWGLHAPGTPFSTVVIRKTTQGDGIGLDGFLHSDLGLPDHCTAAWTDLGFAKPGSLGPPQLSGSGSLASGSANVVTLSAALPLSSTYLVTGFAFLGAPLKGGVLVPTADLILALPTSVSGGMAAPFVMPPGVPPGFELFVQCWTLDPLPSFGLSASNGLRGVTP